MNLYISENNKLKQIDKDTFDLEKDIQSLVETNLEAIFNLEFVSSEFIINEFRIDTLAYDNENNCFVIIEYKKGSSYSVIDQGYSYMSTMLNNKSDFDYIEKIKGKNNKVLKVYTQSESDSISEMNYEKNQIMMEENDFEELGSYFRYDANIRESPKNVNDYNYNGMVRFFKFNDKVSAMVDFNKSIQLNPNSEDQSLYYFIRGLIKKDLNIKGACDDWVKAAGLGFYTAKKMVRENCN